jgi:hypothetical protein
MIALGDRGDTCADDRPLLAAARHGSFHVELGGRYDLTLLYDLPADVRCRDFLSKRSHGPRAEQMRRAAKRKAMHVG